MGSPGDTACLACTCPRPLHRLCPPPEPAPSPVHACTLLWRNLPTPLPPPPRVCPIQPPPWRPGGTLKSPCPVRVGGRAFLAVGRGTGACLPGALQEASPGTGRCRWAEPRGPALLQGGLGLPAALSHPGPSPCGYCCRKRPLGQQSPRWAEGGWWLAGASTRNVAALPIEDGVRGAGGRELVCVCGGASKRLQGRMQWLPPCLGVGWRGLPRVPACGYPFLPKAPARGGSPWR